VLRNNAMGLRILIGIMALGYALRMSKNIFRDMKRTESGNESRYLFNMKVNSWTEHSEAGGKMAVGMKKYTNLLYLIFLELKRLVVKTKYFAEIDIINNCNPITPVSATGVMRPFIMM